MIRRLATLAVFTATAASLIATSRAPEPCAVEQISVLADTTCGSQANVVLASTQSCQVTAMGADFGGLPTGGFIEGGVVDAGLRLGFRLSGTRPDGGSVGCNAEPADAGFTIDCGSCAGTLTPQ